MGIVNISRTMPGTIVLQIFRCLTQRDMLWNIIVENANKEHVLGKAWVCFFLEKLKIVFYGKFLDLEYFLFNRMCRGSVFYVDIRGRVNERVNVDFYINIEYYIEIVTKTQMAWKIKGNQMNIASNPFLFLFQVTANGLMMTHDCPLYFSGKWCD